MQQGVMIQAVVRAFDIIRILASNENAMTVTQIAKEMGLSVSTAFGIVNTMANLGWLEQDYNACYRLGTPFIEMGALVQRRLDVRREAVPYVEMLSERFGETVHLGVYEGGDVLYVEKREAPNRLISYSAVGNRLPMYCTGIGKAMLAFLPGEYLEQYVFSRPLVRHTANTIVEKQALLAELAAIRERGLAMDNGEVGNNLYCVAAPIFTVGDAPVAAISISYYNAVPEERMAAMRDAVRDAAQAISRRMGYGAAEPLRSDGRRAKRRMIALR